MMPAHILVAVVCISLLSIHISVLAGLRTKMDRYICYFLGYVAVHATHAWLVRTHFVDNLQLDYLAPYGLLYGPFLYFAYQVAAGTPIKRRRMLLHGLPFLIFLGCYFLWLAAPSIFREHERLFGLSLYVTLSLSFISYAVWILFSRFGSMELSRNEESRMVSMMAMVMAFIAVIFLAFTYSDAVSGPIRSQFKGSIVFLTMLVATIILFSYIIKRIVGSSEAKEPLVYQKESFEHQPGIESGAATESIRYQKSGIPADQLEAYEASLRQLIEEKRVYLDDELSLASLAQQLKMPKHHLSQVFSSRIGKNFNTYINEHRVNHAVKLLHAHPEMGITDIFLSSGFIAKASFNRYFKQFQGCTPTEYRNGIAE